jgi:hypothetical protein
MIEKFNFENDIDAASILGRGTLVAGSAFGVYKTIKELPSSADPTGFFRRSIAPQAAIAPTFNKAVNPIASSITMSNFLKGIQEPIEPKFATTFLENKTQILEEIGYLGGGFKGRSAGLGQEVTSLYDMVEAKFGSVKAFAFSETKDSISDTIRIVGGKDHVFDIPLVNTEGTMTLGGKNANTYTARSSLAGYGEAGVELEGIDVALARKYKEELGRVKSGELDPRDIKRAATDKAIWEGAKGSGGGVGPLQEIRKEQFVVDLFGQKTVEARVDMMKSIYKIPGYSGGSQSMFVRGVMATPESLLSKGLPGAESSISSYQLIRQSKFEGTKPLLVDWTPGKNSGLGQFKVATIKNMDTYREALKRQGLPVHELAAEEVILSNKSKATIRNKMYNFNVDLQREGTQFGERLMKDVYRQAAEQGMNSADVAKAMTSPGGLDGLNIDLNKKLRRLEERRLGIGREIDTLESTLSTERMKGNRGKTLSKLERQLAGKKRGLQSISESIKGYGVLGYDTIGKPLKVKGGDLSNLVSSIRKHDGILSIGTESTFKYGVMSKSFSGGGGGKWTVKGVGNVAATAGWMEALEAYGPAATEADATDFARAFKDVDILSAEAPVKIKGGVLPVREGMTGIMSYTSGVTAEGNSAAIKRLEEIGVKGGKFIGSNLSGKEMINKIESWHPGQSTEQIFGGEDFLGTKINEMVLSPDISSTQAGVFGQGKMSSRTAFNLQAMGLEDVLEDFTTRRTGEHSPFAQLGEIHAAKNVAGDKAARGISLSDIGGDLEKLFQEDLVGRRNYMQGQDRMTINLGKEIGGLEKVTVFASDAMSPYVGASKAGRSPLDRATFDLLASVKNGQDETFQLAKMKKYQAAFGQVEGAISKNLFGGKVSGSVYGQAVSSLDGMDRAAQELGKVMNVGDEMQAPLIAMTKSDIKEKFGTKALRQAEEGRLWGVMTREPIEGVHSSLPVNVRMAEDFGVTGDQKGRIFVSGENASQSMIRRSMFVDFDKDTLNVIAATSEKSRASIEEFYGYGQKQSIMGSEFVSSVKRMSAFELKGRAPESISSLLNNELVGLNAAQKNLESKIGQFSSEFENIHIGLREQLRPGMGRGAAEAYYLGEDFSHLFVENVLKAKHQGKEALLSGSVDDVLDIFRGSVGTDYARMGKGEKAQNLQRIFDELSFGGKEAGEAIRQSTSSVVSADLAEKMGYAKEMKEARAIESASQRSAEVESIISRATSQRNAYKKISNAKNLENILEAHTLGRELQAAGNYSSAIAQRSISKVSGYKSILKDASTAASAFMSKGLKNIVKWGILPTAGIGLAASLLSKPKMMQPTLNTGMLHEGEKEYVDGLGEASAGKTLFQIPEQKFSSFDIKGKADMTTNFDSLRAHASANMKDLNVRLQDHRSHMDKFTIKEMIGKGY